MYNDMDQDLKEKVFSIVEPYIKELNLVLFELNVRQYHQTVAIEIFVDRVHGGIMVDECTQINRHLARTIEEEEIFEEYMVEVSSPGLDRPLKIQQDFLRVLGRNVRIHLFEPVENKKEYAGIVKEVHDNEVTIETKKGLLTILLENISKAVQVIN